MTTADIIFDTMFAVNPCVVTLGGAQKTHDARKSDELLKRPQVAVDWLPQCGQQAANAGLAGHLRWLQRDNTNNYNTTSSPLLVQLLLLLMLRVADPLREWPTESGVYRQYLTRIMYIARRRTSSRTLRTVLAVDQAGFAAVNSERPRDATSRRREAAETVQLARLF